MAGKEINNGSLPSPATEGIANRTERQARIWPWVLIAIMPLLYWFSIGPFFRWEHAARTQRQYRERKKLAKRLYAPIIWLERHDPTQAIFIFDGWYIRLCTNPGFSAAALPKD